MSIAPTGAPSRCVEAMKRRNNAKGGACVIVTMEAGEDAAESGHVGVMIPRKHPVFLSNMPTMYFPSLCPLWAPENREMWKGVTIAHAATDWRGVRQ